MQMNVKFIKKAAACVLVLTLALTVLCPLSALASAPRTIRVGYFAFPGYHDVSQGENGPQGSGYGFDFLLI